MTIQLNQILKNIALGGTNPESDQDAEKLGEDVIRGTLKSVEKM